MSTKFEDDVEVVSPAVLTLGVLPVLPDAGFNGLLAWDDTDNAVVYVHIGTNLTYDHSTHTLNATGGGGSGTVTSVDITQPAAGITASGGPITTSGSITLALANDLAALEGLSSTGLAARTGTDTWAQRTITGTSNKIDVTNGNGVSGNPTITISATYVGQTSITTLGTVTTGTWNAGTIRASGQSEFFTSDSATTTVLSVFQVGHYTSGTAAAGFGVSFTFAGSNGVALVTYGAISAITVNAATPTYRVVHEAYDTLPREGFRIESNGSAAMIGFLGASASLRLASPDAGTALVTFGLASGTPTFAVANLSGATLPAAIVTSSLTSVGTLTGGATGAGFTVALGTSTITGILGSAHGGTANGFTKFSGPTTSEKTFTLPDATCAILTTNALVTGAQGGTANGFFEVSGPASTTKTFTFPNASATVLTSNAAVTVAQGGTGATTLTIHGILLGQTTGAIVATAAMSDGQLLVGQTSADPLPKTITGDVTITAAGATAIGATKVTNAMLAGSIDLTTKVTGRLPMANAPLTTDVYAWLITTAITMTNGAWTTVVFNNESTDALNEYDPTTGTFTPSVTGRYLITAAYTAAGATARIILAIWTGTSAELQRMADGVLTLAGSTVMVDLTGSTGYTIRGFVTNAGVTAAIGQSSTYLLIRRLS